MGRGAGYRTLGRVARGPGGPAAEVSSQCPSYREVPLDLPTTGHPLPFRTGLLGGFPLCVVLLSYAAYKNPGSKTIFLS